ncbi:MAG: 16S rRNA (uracil(1498)-N(3))-methyltransferase [Chloroflexia bacterium]
MNRFFIPLPEPPPDRLDIAEPALVHRMRDVLRLKPGDAVVVFDNSGWEYEVRLEEVEPDRILGQIHKRRLCRNEPHTQVTLYQAVLKGERFEWALQKGTEVGVSAFVPLLSERCIVQDAHQLSRRKLQRWEKIIQAAAEQSRRGRVPPLKPLMLFAAACEQVHHTGELALLPWEEASTPLRDVLGKIGPGNPFNVAIFIGPEGGFSEAEVQRARHYGLHPVSLGPRILRAETAGVVATALVLYHYGDL